MLAYAARQAVLGQSWGLAVIVTVGTLVMMFAAYIIIFSATWTLGTFVGLLKNQPAPESPFASSKAPPQVIAPTSPDLEE